jgi:6-phosphogluconate dehydrogenase
MIGLGRMGANMAERLVLGGHRVVAYDRNPDAVRRVAEKGAAGAQSVREVAESLKTPRALWVMVPSGDPVDETIAALRPHLAKGDVVVDGGNSNYQHTLQRAEALRAHGVHLVDAGTSGGIWGLKEGYCMMVGGEQEAVERLTPVLKTLAPENGYAHVGPTGAGHFVKMVHNGIEYGMLQAYGEGFEMLKRSRFPLDLGKIAHLWNHASVVRSWILELAESVLQRDPDLASIRGFVEDSGEGRWAVHEAVDSEVSAPVLALSLFARYASRQDDAFSAKVIAALRNEFGGHPIKRK